MGHSTWLEEPLDREKRVSLIKGFRKFFTRGRSEITVVGSGLSGTLPLGMLAGIRPQIPLAVIRREGETGMDLVHSVRDVECDKSFKPHSSAFTLIDDFTCSGTTLRYIARKLNPLNCGYVLFYGQDIENDYRVAETLGVFPNAKVHFFLKGSFKWQKKTEAVKSYLTGWE